MFVVKAAHLHQSFSSIQPRLLKFVFLQLLYLPTFSRRSGFLSLRAAAPLLQQQFSLILEIAST